MTTGGKLYDFDYKQHRDALVSILNELDKFSNLTWDDYRKVLNKHPKEKGKLFSKNNLVIGYKALLEEDYPNLPKSKNLLTKIQMKPIRTQSGVTPVTVLTKPFPCPGRCIFCPNDIRMPKSYLSDEPGAQRAERNNFDPYLQTYRRLEAYRNIGHSTDKIEIIVLGGTWSFYPEHYQIWFIKRCFEAINDFSDGKNQIIDAEQNSKTLDINKITEIDKSGKDYNHLINELSKKSGLQLNDKTESSSWEELFFEHKRNETSNCRCVGLVVETRPDHISKQEVIRIRKLGCTKTQIGFQSLNDEVLDKNHRGHNVEATRRAVKLLRQAGFKIHAHWMANLYGSNVEKDIEDFKCLFTDNDFKPDELKIYPCSLIETAELMEYYKDGRWKPYNFEELLKVVTQSIKNTPEYCRLTRIIRDIPGTDIVVGNKITNFREIAEKELDKQKIERQDIRSREIKNKEIKRQDLELKTISYQTSAGYEYFLQFVTQTNQIAGFLRLLLPNIENENQKVTNFDHDFIPELSNSAIIREIHVYGRVAGLGTKDTGKAQHLGLGKELIIKAVKIAKSRDYEKISVISAIGTREYYRKQNFEDGEMYQFIDLNEHRINLLF